MTVVLDAGPQRETASRISLLFTEGLPGLEEHRRFTLVGVDDLPVYWLECDDEPLLALPLANAFAVFPEYSIEISDGDARDLGLKCPEDALVLLVVTMCAAPPSLTANALAPLVIGRHSRLARQLILDGSGYSLRHTIELPE